MTARDPAQDRSAATEKNDASNRVLARRRDPFRGTCFSRIDDRKSLDDPKTLAKGKLRRIAPMWKGQCSESDTCYLFPRISSSAFNARRSRVMMSSAVFVHLKGFGFSFW